MTKLEEIIKMMKYICKNSPCGCCSECMFTVICNELSHSPSQISTEEIIEELNKEV